MLGDMIMQDIAFMGRREMMQQLALLLGASALPLDAFAAVTAKNKRFLPAASYKLLTAIADTIIPATDTPGAVGAGVPAKVDYMIAKWASPERRKALVGAMAAIDQLAKTQTKTGFAALAPEKRKALLIEHDKAALKPVAKVPGAKNLGSVFSREPSVADPGYSKLKDLVVAIYYNSEIAMTREIIYEHVPGGWTPSIKTTPETRPYAGTGPF
jgi:gluconate 2-dehydrogenase gamma chain